MLNLEDGIDSLTNFKRQTAEYLKRLHKTGEPVVLTVNGKAQSSSRTQPLIKSCSKRRRRPNARRRWRRFARDWRTSRRAAQSRRGPRSRLGQEIRHRDAGQVIRIARHETKRKDPGPTDGNSQWVVCSKARERLRCTHTDQTFSPPLEPAVGNTLCADDRPTSICGVSCEGPGEESYSCVLLGEGGATAVHGNPAVIVGDQCFVAVGYTLCVRLFRRSICHGHRKSTRPRASAFTTAKSRTV